jgi:hypothetical protein
LKKLAAIVVLIIFMVNAMGYLIVFRYNQYLIRQEMVARIRCGAFPDKIVLLKFLHPEREKQFIRLEQTEFTYIGKLYDVVAEGKSGDTTLFYCLHDKKEEDLLADYTLYLRRNGDSSQKDNSILALLYNLVTQALIQNPSIPPQGQGIAFQFPFSKILITPVYLVHAAPPPKSA